MEKWEGCKIIVFPNHCELNFIEMVWWGYHPRTCTYNFTDQQHYEFASGFRAAGPHVLLAVYREGLAGTEFDYAVKKHRGHRCILVGQLERIRAAFVEKR